MEWTLAYFSSNSPALVCGDDSHGEVCNMAYIVKRNRLVRFVLLSRPILASPFCMPWSKNRETIVWICLDFQREKSQLPVFVQINPATAAPRQNVALMTMVMSSGTRFRCQGLPRRPDDYQLSIANMVVFEAPDSRQLSFLNPTDLITSHSDNAPKLLVGGLERRWCPVK